MKKSALAVFVILALLTSCNYSSDLSSPKTEAPPSESGIFSADSSKPESPAFSTDSSAPEKILSSEDTGRLEQSVIELMKAGTFSLYFTMDLTYPDFKYQLDCIMAQDGDKYVFLSEGDVPIMGYLKSRTINKEGYTYFVDDVEKTYSSGIDDEDAETAPDFSSMEFLSKGKEAIDGIQYEYEEYRIDDTDMRFYFNSNNQLHAIKGVAETVNATLDDSMYGDLLILVKDVVPVTPIGIFDIPSDYTVVE